MIPVRFDWFSDLDHAALPASPAWQDSFQLRRSWPVSASHLLLEYRSSQGQILTAQASRDHGDLQQQAARIQRATGQLPPLLSYPNGWSLLLQANGVDARLITLQRLLRSDRAQLLSHRPNKRAMLQWHTGHAPFFCKLLASRRAFRRVLTGFSWAASHSGYPCDAIQQSRFRTPELQRVLPHSRTLVTTQVAGISLYDALRHDRCDPAMAYQIGQALKALQTSEAGTNLQSHSHRDEADVLVQWAASVEAYQPELAALVQQPLARVVAALLASDQDWVIAHRDLHDKQILLLPEQPPGLIDFDTIAMAHPALDLANLLAHLELRQLQGYAGAAPIGAIAAALVAGYGDLPPGGALQAYLDSARLRLACVYAFRPRWHGIIATIVTRIGTEYGEPLFC